MADPAPKQRTALIVIGLVLAWMAAACADNNDSTGQTSSTSTTTTTTTATTTTTPQAEAPQTTAPPNTTTTVAEHDLIAWEDLENLSFQLAGDTIELHNGEAAVSYGGESASMFLLQNRVTQGDLDDDGDDDLVAHIIERSTGTGVFHLIVPVLDNDGTPEPQTPVYVGDRVVIEAISIQDSLIEVALLDRKDNEPFTVITQRKTLEIDLSEAEPQARMVSSRPLKDLPLPDLDLPEISIQLEAGAISATESGSIEPNQRQTYTLQAAEGQELSVELTAPLGVWLTVDLGYFVLASAEDRAQEATATLPVSGPWRLTVVSTHGETADYEMTATILPLGPPSDPGTAVPLPTIPTAPTADPGDIVYLTIDDGPHPVYTPQILDVLARHNTRATFFVVGYLVERYPAVFERIVAEGHTVGNHTWRHEDLTTLSRDSFDETVARTQEILGEHATPCLRPPYGSRDAFTREWAAAHGLALALWTVDTFDWRNPGAAMIANRIVAGATDGAIVSLHDGGGDRSQTVEALDDAISRLSGTGIRFEPLCQ
ncbi:MAG: polysaccharide deacetylase family protein [Acidimicrobiaceae bacterium]|nr:polysaccharide deacetylase family protein [Acidimicrobiaceae bacterium]